MYRIDLRKKLTCSEKKLALCRIRREKIKMLRFPKTNRIECLVAPVAYGKSYFSKTLNDYYVLDSDLFRSDLGINGDCGLISNNYVFYVNDVLMEFIFQNKINSVIMFSLTSLNSLQWFIKNILPKCRTHINKSISLKKLIERNFLRKFVEQRFVEDEKIMTSYDTCRRLKSLIFNLRSSTTIRLF